MQSEIPEGWQERALGQCAEYINGYAFKPDDWHKYGTPIIRIEQLNNPQAKHDFYPKQLPDKFVIYDGDLIFSWSATLSLKIWDRGKAYLNQHLYKVITKKRVDKLFLKYLMEFNLEKLAGETHGSTMKHITRPHLLGYPVILPKTTEEQEQIAFILLTIDKVIEKTKALIEKNKKIKQGLMMDLLDPREHQDGWEEKSLGSCASYINGFAFKPSDWKEYGIPIIRIEQLNNVKAKCDYHDKTLPNKYVLENGDLVFSWSATLSLKIWDRGRALLNQHLFKVLTKHDVDKEYLKYLIEINLDKLAGETHGSTMRHITRPHLLKYMVKIPIKLKEQQRIVSVLNAIDNNIEQENKKWDKLIRIKSGLMQDLLTGKVRIKVGAA